MIFAPNCTFARQFWAQPYRCPFAVTKQCQSSGQVFGPKSLFFSGVLRLHFVAPKARFHYRQLSSRARTAANSLSTAFSRPNHTFHRQAKTNEEKVERKEHCPNPSFFPRVLRANFPLKNRAIYVKKVPASISDRIPHSAFPIPPSPVPQLARVKHV